MISRHGITRLMPLALTFVLLSSVNLYAQDRMPPIPVDRMTEAQKKAADEFAAVRNSAPTGPFSVLLRVPELMDLGFRWRQHVQLRSVLNPRLTELAILMTAREWTQQYEWNAHHAAALKAGLKPDTIAAVAEGRRPDRMAADEAVLYDVILELQRHHSVSDATYARALAAFGEAGVVETASIAGYYTLLAIVMNTARTPLPAGAKPPLPALP